MPVNPQVLTMSPAVVAVLIQFLQWVLTDADVPDRRGVFSGGLASGEQKTRDEVCILIILLFNE